MTLWKRLLQALIVEITTMLERLKGWGREIERDERDTEDWLRKSCSNNLQLHTRDVLGSGFQTVT